ncbi:MAG: hypothetical protein AB4352_20495 [Hormoscilla sp.]
MARLVFLDNDVILKLVFCNLFWEAVASLELSPEIIGDRSRIRLQKLTLTWAMEPRAIAHTEKSM